MTAIAKLYRLRVATAGATAVAGNVDWETTSLIAEVPELGGQRVEALEARTSARPWSVLLDDAEEAVTAKLASAAGRYHMIGRLVDFSVSLDGGSTFTVLQTGRIDDISLEGVVRYRIEVTDERQVERTSTIFGGKNTTRVAPSGLHAQWLHWHPGPAFRFVCVAVDEANERTRYDAVGVGSPEDHRGLGNNPGGPLNQEGLRLTKAAIALLEEDDFATLRCNVDGTDRVVRRFNRDSPGQWTKLRERGVIDSFEVEGFADPVGQGAVRSCYFHMPTHDPTPDIPRHIGGRLGIDPFQLAKDIYDGVYGGGPVRYDSECFSAYDPESNPRGLIGRFPKQWYRVDGPANMATWLQENVYTPLKVAPILNAAGEVAPVFVGQPDTAAIPDVDELPTFTASNSSLHPTWNQRGRDQVTILRATFRHARLAGPLDEERDVALDGLVWQEYAHEVEHDNAANVRAPHEVTVTGQHRPGDFLHETRRMGREMFDRFGDGPVYSRVRTVAGELEDLIPGTWVAIDFDSYPAAQDQARGGTRIAQVLTRTVLPAGVEYELLEAGALAQPLGTPTVALATNSDDPHHAVNVTISGLGTGEGYELHLAVSTTEPDEESDAWTYRVLRGTGNETVTVSRLPSGSTIWGRARATAPGRISSDWSTADDASTTALTAPTAASVGDIEGGTATLSWTPGEADYDVVVDLDEVPEARLVAGSTEYRFEGLPPSTALEAGVKHVDDYGGESARASDDFNSGSTDDDVPDMQGIRILVGLEP